MWNWCSTFTARRGNLIASIQLFSGRIKSIGPPCYRFGLWLNSERVTCAYQPVYRWPFGGSRIFCSVNLTVLATCRRTYDADLCRLERSPIVRGILCGSQVTCPRLESNRLERGSPSLKAPRSGQSGQPTDGTSCGFSLPCRCSVFHNLFIRSPVLRALWHVFLSCFVIFGIF